MKDSLLIVEDEYIVANDLRIILRSAGYTVCGICGSVAEARIAVEKYKPTWVLLDIFLQDDSMGTELAPYLQEKNIGYIYISANTNQTVLEIAKSTQPYGFLVKPFREKDLLLMLDIAREKHQSNLQFSQQRELMLHNQLSGLSNGKSDHEQLLLQIPSLFQSVISFDLFEYEWYPGNGRPTKRQFYRVAFDEYQVTEANFTSQEGGSTVGPQSEIFNNESFSNLSATASHVRQVSDLYRLQSALFFAGTQSDARFILHFYSKKAEGFNLSQINLLRRSEEQFVRLFQVLDELKGRVGQTSLRKATRVTSREKPTASGRFDGIIGESKALMEVLDSIQMVASAPVSVLILGESGTGKEKIAHNVHFLSARSSGPFITVNCAALPVELIESELFGHEKGAFTGALEKRIGKFEIAHGGTIFLDEVGEMPLESQVKMLRVLQEKEFEPVGSNKPIKVDVRVIAATNKNLEKEVAEGRFRLDLFYRLNVFPIDVPPLRERKEDIALLARHFLAKCANLMERSDIPEISPEALKQLQSYNWPGNIRELEHLMERTLIRTATGNILSIALPATGPGATVLKYSSVPTKTLEEIEKEHILNVLQSCNGKVFGAGGAAELLGLPPSTLTSRMKKLGIKKEHNFER